MLDSLFKIAAAVVVRLKMEIAELEEGVVVTLGIADDDDIAADDPEDDVYATRMGFSTERGRLIQKEE